MTQWLNKWCNVFTNHEVAYFTQAALVDAHAEVQKCCRIEMFKAIRTMLCKLIVNYLVAVQVNVCFYPVVKFVAIGRRGTESGPHFMEPIVYGTEHSLTFLHSCVLPIKKSH